MLKIICFNEVSSTNDVAIDMVVKQGCADDVLVMAETQTAGRGRLNERTWSSPRGNFYGTYILNIKNLGISESSVSILNRQSLLAVYDEINRLRGASFAKKKDVVIKYPDDILINGKKISGILVEVLYPYALIGIGINLLISPIELATDIQKEFNLVVSSKELGENLYIFLLKRIKDAGV